MKKILSNCFLIVWNLSHDSFKNPSLQFQVSEKYSDYEVLIIAFSVAALCIIHFCIIHVFFSSFF